ncbi:MAG: PLP-dependent cysteine synthase family protein, partial [Candidatus Bathyarchaeia archaeon]
MGVFVSIKPFKNLDNDASNSLESKIMQLKKRIGNTPLQLVDRVYGNPIYAKLEYYNPLSYSVKDRAAVYMVSGAIERGEVDPSADLVWIEASSGNLGIAYGQVCNHLGLKSMIVVPSVVGDAAFKRVRSSASECEITPDGYCPRGERDGAIRRVYDLWSKGSKYVWRDQYSSSDNIRAHYETTGPEIWRQTDGKLTTLVSATGTGGTIIGSSSYLKETSLEIEALAVQAQVGHHIQGVRNFEESMKPIIVKDNEDLIDEWVEVGDEEAFEATEYLWRVGYPVGTSSGLNYAASRKIARKRRNALIVT